MVQATLETTVSSIRLSMGHLLNAHSNVVPGTEQHAHEIMALRESRPKFRNLFVWTADFPMYSLDASGEAVFSLATREHHLGFRHIGDYVTCLISSNTGYNYFIKSREEIGEVLNAKSTVTGKISELKLIKEDSNSAWGYFETRNMTTDAQRRVTERVYRTGEPMGDRVYILTQESVKEALKGKEGQAFARASRLGGADFGSVFGAYVGAFGSACEGLLGALKEAPEATRKN